MQDKDAYVEGKDVYVQNVGNGKEVLQIEEVLKNGNYKLRKSDTGEILDNEFSEEDLRPNPLKT